MSARAGRQFHGSSSLSRFCRVSAMRERTSASQACGSTSLSFAVVIPTEGVRVWLATGYTDMRCGFPSLALRVQEVLKTGVR